MAAVLKWLQGHQCHRSAPLVPRHQRSRIMCTIVELQDGAQRERLDGKYLVTRHFTYVMRCAVAGAHLQPSALLAMAIATRSPAGRCAQVAAGGLRQEQRKPHPQPHTGLERFGDRQRIGCGVVRRQRQEHAGLRDCVQYCRIAYRSDTPRKLIVAAGLPSLSATAHSSPIK